MQKNIIYYSDACPFCHNAYQLLKNKGVPLQKKYVKNQNDWNEVLEKTGRTTIPQIFINGVHIGGFDDLSAVEKSGKLDDILKAS